MTTTKTIDEGRCTSVTLRALGVAFSETPVDGHHMLEMIRATGVKVGIFGARNDVADYAWIDGTKTVRAFVAAHPRGRFYISTRGHAMAVVDGVLYDAAEKGLDGRRIQSAAEVVG